jgi:nitrate/nitrite transporter NarK
MKLADLKNSGHWPTLLAAFLYFDFSFMVWTVLGPLGAPIGESLNLSAEQKGLMVALPILAGALLRILLGLFVDRVGAKNAGITAQLVVITGLALAWIFGLPNFEATLLMGLVLGFAGASFAVALPQAGRWYPPNMQGVVMGLAGAGNIGVVLDSLLAPRIAEAFGWKSVFGFALIPAILVLVFGLEINVTIDPLKNPFRPQRLQTAIERFTEAAKVLIIDVSQGQDGIIQTGELEIIFGFELFPELDGIVRRISLTPGTRDNERTLLMGERRRSSLFQRGDRCFKTLFFCFLH